MSMKIAVYPGSFDPITNGHLDIIERAASIFDKLIVVVAYNSSKQSTFSVDERVEMIKEAVSYLPNVEVDKTTGLTVEYAVFKGACTLVRGLRAVTDYELEFQMNVANTFINSSVESIYLMSRKEYTFISSSIIKELYSHGVDISTLVPSSVLKCFKSREK